VLPRPSAHVSQIGATRGHPIHPWSFLPELHSPPLKLLPSRSFWHLAWAIPTCHAHASRHSLQRTKHNHHLATKLPLNRRVVSLVSLATCTSMYPFSLLLPASILPAPVLPKKQQCVVEASSAHLGRAQIAQLTVRLRIGILPFLPASCNPAPAVSHKAAETCTRVRRPSASAETPVQFHPNEHRLQTRNTPAESQLPGSPNSPCVSISCFSSCPHPRRVCRKPFEPSH
jgi:hypothetical protein